MMASYSDTSDMAAKDRRHLTMTASKWDEILVAPAYTRSLTPTNATRAVRRQAHSRAVDLGPSRLWASGLMILVRLSSREQR